MGHCSCCCVTVFWAYYHAFCVNLSGAYPVAARRSRAVEAFCGRWRTGYAHCCRPTFGGSLGSRCWICPCLLFLPPFPQQLFVRSRRASGQSAWPGCPVPEVTWLCVLGCDRRRKRCRSRPRQLSTCECVSVYKFCHQRKASHGWGKREKETPQLARTTKMPRRSLLRC